MRVTEQQVFGFLLNNYQRARSRALELQEHLATGKQVLQPSDDPGRFHRIVGEKTTLAKLEQYLRNVGAANTRVDLADASLQGTTTTLSRIRQLAVQYASDTNGAADRATGGHEIKELLQHLLQLGNTEFDENQPVFGGTSRHGFAAGLALATPVTVTNAVADTLTVKVDGVTSGTIDLTDSTETLDGPALAARVQSRINTDSTLIAAGKSVSVTYAEGGLAVSSNSEGPTSKVEVVGGSARALLGFNGGSVGVGTATFVTTVATNSAATNSGGALVSQGEIVSTSAISFDNYAIRFTGPGSFDILNISAPVTVTANSSNAGRLGRIDAGIVDPQRITLNAYEVQFTSASQYSVLNTTTGATISTGNSYVSGGAIAFDGLRVVLANGQQGGPSTGDRFTVAVAPKSVLSSQPYTSGSPIVFDGVQLHITNGSSPPAAGDLFRVVAHTKYAGDSGSHLIEVADGEVIPTNLPGDRAFSGSTVNLFDTVQRLLAALRGNFKAGIVESLGDLDRAISQVSTALGTIGAVTNRLESTSVALQESKDLATNQLSSFEDIDLARTISDLTLQEYAIQAAGATLGRLFDNSLLKHLR
ncbi:MAG: flagellin N-terminal helical domain-containing protein [Nitrospira sp.]